MSLASEPAVPLQQNKINIPGPEIPLTNRQNFSLLTSCFFRLVVHRARGHFTGIPLPHFRKYGPDFWQYQKLASRNRNKVGQPTNPKRANARRNKQHLAATSRDDSKSKFPHASSTYATSGCSRNQTKEWLEAFPSSKLWWRPSQRQRVYQRLPGILPPPSR